MSDLPPRPAPTNHNKQKLDQYEIFMKTDFEWNMKKITKLLQLDAKNVGI